jgi:hypothetical protein
MTSKENMFITVRLHEEYIIWLVNQTAKIWNIDGTFLHPSIAADLCLPSVIKLCSKDIPNLYRKSIRKGRHNTFTEATQHKYV